jgi:hypothetical protein
LNDPIATHLKPRVICDEIEQTMMREVPGK